MANNTNVVVAAIPATAKRAAQKPPLRPSGSSTANQASPFKSMEFMQRSSPWYPKFSAFFKKIIIYLDQGFYPDNDVVVWDSARSPAQQDGFEVKRKGDKEFTAVIRMAMNYTPKKFMVSSQLSKVLGIEFNTHARIIAALWHYANDPSFF